jgi:hypothetical protein
MSSTAILQLHSMLINQFRWASLLGQHVEHQAEQRFWVLYPQINRDEGPSPDKWGGALCVVQDLEVICKHDCVGDSKGFVGCSWLESITVVIGWWLSILIVTWNREINLKP